MNANNNRCRGVIETFDGSTIDYDEIMGYERPNQRRGSDHQGRNRRHQNTIDHDDLDALKKAKIDLPTFDGHLDHDIFVDWLR